MKKSYHDLFIKISKVHPTPNNGNDEIGWRRYIDIEGVNDLFELEYKSKKGKLIKIHFNECFSEKEISYNQLEYFPDRLSYRLEVMRKVVLKKEPIRTTEQFKEVLDRINKNKIICKD